MIHKCFVLKKEQKGPDGKLRNYYLSHDLHDYIAVVTFFTPLLSRAWLFETHAAALYAQELFKGEILTIKIKIVESSIVKKGEIHAKRKENIIDQR